MFKTGKFYKDLKRFIIAMLAICFSLTAFVTTVTVVNKILQNRNGLSVSAAYSFTTTELKPGDNNYKNNSEFHISSDSALRGFAGSVANGCTFKGKTVKLTDDIEITREYDDNLNTFRGVGYPSSTVIAQYKKAGANPPIYAFCGTFDGCGYTVNKFKMQVNYCHNLKEWGDDVYIMDSGAYLGFFGVLAGGAVVKDLKLSNLNYYVSEYDYVYNSEWAYVGAIAGLVIDGATIEGCEVSSFNVYDGSGTGKNNRDEFVGGLVGGIGYSSQGSPAYTIKNCNVEGFKCSLYTTEYGYLPYGSYDRAIGAFVGVDNCNGYGEGICGTISNCILKDSNSYIATNGYKFEYVAGYLTEPNSGSKQYITKQSDYSSFETNITKGGANVGGYWYWNKDYNGGYPRLRQFITTWQEVKFYANPSGSATFSEDSVYVPEWSSKFSSKSDTIDIFGNVVVATPAAGYRVSSTGWTCDVANKSYVINCEQIPFKLTFANSYTTHASMKVDGTVKTSETIELTYGSTVNFSYTQSGGIYTYTYVVKNASGTTLKTITYTTTNNKYMMLKNGSNLKNGMDGKSVYTITFNAQKLTGTISPEFGLKVYDVELE